jgi:hypothetical protein
MGLANVLDKKTLGFDNQQNPRQYGLGERVGPKTPGLGNQSNPICLTYYFINYM